MAFSDVAVDYTVPNTVTLTQVTKYKKATVGLRREGGGGGAGHNRQYSLSLVVKL